MSNTRHTESMATSRTESRTGLPVETIPTRTINVEVPESVYWHIRKCAIESQLSMKDYMAKFCQEAWSYPPEQSGN